CTREGVVDLALEDWDPLFDYW
nr:immunoglobulin heavy chain junction region [Macaca mulatta]MOY21182.1 immunoglobulin heavy chain junction region [Macaca mulatta]MOY21953.1 immunoglobulin heavy chain junction region [Macaca mulatta]MOY22849.1 immunoglobulin heavy chain junction region [Macaca mulatta]MOY28937.1 immunoglobulin heavy chain junction region [Macaca mulatta]